MGERALSIGFGVALSLGAACSDSGSGPPAQAESDTEFDTGDASSTGSLATEAGSESSSSEAGSEGSSSGDGDTSDLIFEGCDGSSSAHQVFNAYWTEFDQYYALFDVRLPQTTWGALGASACDELTDDTPEDALFEVLLSMAQALNDGHVQLEAPSLGRYADGWVSAYPYDEELDELEFGVEANYLAGPLSWAANDWFAWGSVGSVGYISITSFDELSASGDEDDDRDAADAAMAAALAELGASTGLIIDVRANGGGWDYVALDVARWVSGDATLAWSEAYRDGPEHDDFSAWEDVDVGAAVPNAFAGPVVVLTSGGTFSAAETFVLAMRVRQSVTVVGEPTSGHFSDLFDADLPNGWSFTYSGERYRAADGMIYESIGAPVDIPVDLDVAALDDGQDVQLEAALAQLGG